MIKQGSVLKFCVRNLHKYKKNHRSILRHGVARFLSENIIYEMKPGNVKCS